MQNAPSGRFDYLVIGHVTRDVAPDGRFIPGGTASYATRTAQALGKRAGVITSASPDEDLERLLAAETLRISAATTTAFKNQYGPSGREQVLLSVATPLSPAEIPDRWREAAVVHIGPVAQECDPALAHLFPTAFLGITPQGWMRSWDDRGRVYHTDWENAEAILARSDAVVLSEEDIAGQEAPLPRWARTTPVLVVTRGADGCTIYTEGRSHDVPGIPVKTVDPTGAGDIFAATLFILLESGLPAVEAARRANCIAAYSVTRAGLASIPTPSEIARCLR